MDAVFAWSLPGGRGDGVRLLILDAGFGEGADADEVEHAIGMASIAAALAPGAELRRAGFRFDAPRHHAIADALAAASRDLGPGDEVLLEVQARRDGVFLPIEVHGCVFDEIAALSARGVTVVEPAGNGAAALDGVLARDSGAIVTGAAYSPLHGAGVPGAPPPRTRSWSNHGPRVDCYGWGDSLPRRQPGGALVEDGGGTSGASAMVAGALACAQGALRMLRGGPIAPPALRALAREGTPSARPSDEIGAMPDLRRILRTV